MMRDKDFCEERGRRILARMPDRVRAPVQDMIAELLCGGGDEADALTPPEAARFLGQRPEYAYAVIQRLDRRVFGDRGKEAA